MNAADLFFAASVVAEALAYIALIFAPGLVVAASFHFTKQAMARRSWAASCRTVAAEYRHDESLLDDVAHIVDTYADRITPLYGKGE